MRFAIAALVVAVLAPSSQAAGKGSPKHQCKTMCDNNYEFCTKRATTKAARHTCKVSRKSCNKVCG
jgi:hypothetical protein